MVGKLINIKLYYRYIPQIQRQEFQGALWKWYSWPFSKIPNKTSRSESLIEKVAGCWLIKKRLRYRYFPAKFLRQLFLRTFASRCKNSTIINCFVKINHLLQQRKEKITAGVFVPFHFLELPSNMLKRKSFVQTNLVYNRSSLWCDLHWPIKFQDFCDRTMNSPYIYTPKCRTKNWFEFIERQCS